MSSEGEINPHLRVDLIRSGFVAQGTTLAEWCRNNGFHRPNVMKALLGQWTGPKAARTVDVVSAAANLERKKCS